MIVSLTPIVSRSKSKWYKPKKVKKLALNSQYLILYLSYFITTVQAIEKCRVSNLESEKNHVLSSDLLAVLEEFV